MSGRLRRRAPAEKEQQMAESNTAEELITTGRPTADDTAEENPTNVDEAENTSLADPSTPDGHNSDVARFSWTRALTYAVVPAIALILAGAAAWIKWQDSTGRMAVPAGIEAVQAASDSAVAMLSYRPDTVENDLGGVQDRLTGGFRNTYTALVRDVVIPAAKQKHIAAVANVPAAAVISAVSDHAVVLLSVNQTVTVGNDTPSGTTSSIRVTLDKVGGHWLVADFTPV